MIYVHTDNVFNARRDLSLQTLGHFCQEASKNGWVLKREERQGLWKMEFHYPSLRRQVAGNWRESEGAALADACIALMEWGHA